MRLLPQISIRKIIVFAFISSLVLFVIFKAWVNIGEFSSVIHRISWLYFFLAFLMMIPISVLGVVRWYLILRASGFSVPFTKVFKIVLSSISLSLIPGRLGDLARSYPLRKTIPASQSIGTIILEKVIDISVLTFFSGIGLLSLGHRVIGILVLLAAISAIPLLEVLNFISQKISLKNSLTDKLIDAISIINKVKNRKITISTAVLTSATNWVLSISQVYWLFKAVGSAVPFSAVFAFHPLSTFAGLIPITLAGVGTRDSAIIYFFRNFAAPEQSLAVGILYSIQAYWILGLLGIPLLYYFFRQNN